MGKGRKQRMVPTHPATLEALTALDTVGPYALGGISAHWVSNSGSTFLRGLGWEVKRPMHSLRAWFATETYRESGQDILLVRDLLGHTSTDTTALYVGVGKDAATKAVMSLNAA